MPEPKSFRDLTLPQAGPLLFADLRRGLKKTAPPMLFGEALARPAPLLFDDLAKDAPFDESKHPRDEHGRWSTAATVGTGLAIGTAAAIAGAVGYAALTRGRALYALSKERNLVHYALDRAKADVAGAEGMLATARTTEEAAAKAATGAAAAVKVRRTAMGALTRTIKDTEGQLAEADLAVTRAKGALERKAAEIEQTNKEFNAAKEHHGADHEHTAALDEKVSKLSEELAAAEDSHKAAATGHKRLADLLDKHRADYKSLAETKTTVGSAVEEAAAAHAKAVGERTALETRKAAAEARVARHDAEIARTQAEHAALNGDPLARAGRAVHSFGEQFRAYDPYRMVPEGIRKELKGIVDGQVGRAPGEEHLLSAHAVSTFNTTYTSRIGEVGQEIAHREATAAARAAVTSAAEKLAPHNPDRLIARLELSTKAAADAEDRSFSFRDAAHKAWQGILYLAGMKDTTLGGAFDSLFPPAIRRTFVAAGALTGLGYEGYSIVSGSHPDNQFLQVQSKDGKGQVHNVLLVTADKEGRGGISTDPAARAPQRGDRHQGQGSGGKTVEGGPERIRAHIAEARARNDLKTAEGRNRTIAAMSLKQISNVQERQNLLRSAVDGNNEELPRKWTLEGVEEFLTNRKASGIYETDRNAREADKEKIRALASNDDRTRAFGHFDRLFKADARPDLEAEVERDHGNWQYDELSKVISRRINDGSIDSFDRLLSKDVIDDTTLKETHKVHLLLDIDFHDSHPDSRFRVKESLRDRLDKNFEAYVDNDVFDADMYRINHYPFLTDADRVDLRRRAWKLHNAATGDGRRDRHMKSDPSVPLGAPLLFDAAAGLAGSGPRLPLLFDAVRGAPAGPMLFKDAAFNEQDHPRDGQGRWVDIATLGAGLAAGAALGYGAWRMLGRRAPRLAAHAGEKAAGESEPAMAAAVKPPPEAPPAAPTPPPTPGITGRPRRARRPKDAALDQPKDVEGFKRYIGAQIAAHEKTRVEDPTRGNGILRTLFSGMHHFVTETAEGGEIVHGDPYLRAIVQRVDFGRTRAVIKPEKARARLESIIEANRHSYLASPDLVDIDLGRARYYPALSDADRKALSARIEALGNPGKVAAAEARREASESRVVTARTGRGPVTKADGGGLGKGFREDIRQRFDELWDETLHPRDTRGRFKDDAEPDTVPSKELAHRHASRAGARDTRPYNRTYHDIRMDTDEAYRALHSQIIEEKRGSKVGPAVGAGSFAAGGGAVGLATGYGLSRAHPAAGRVMGAAAGAVAGGAAGSAAGLVSGLLGRGWMHQRLIRGATHTLGGAFLGARGGAKFGWKRPRLAAAVGTGAAGAAYASPYGEAIGAGIGGVWDTARTTRSVDKADGPVLFGDLAKAWTESAHPRAHAGDEHAGRFVPAEGTLENAGGMFGGASLGVVGERLAGRVLDRLPARPGRTLATIFGRLAAGAAAGTVGSIAGSAAGQGVDRIAGTEARGAAPPEGPHESLGRTIGGLAASGVGIASGAHIGLTAAAARRNPYLAIATSALGAGAATYTAATLGGALGAYADETPEHRHAIAAALTAGVGGLALWQRRRIARQMRTHGATFLSMLRDSRDSWRAALGPRAPKA